jgi:hypothetical protein
MSSYFFLLDNPFSVRYKADQNGLGASSRLRHQPLETVRLESKREAGLKTCNLLNRFAGSRYEAGKAIGQPTDRPPSSGMLKG